MSLSIVNQKSLDLSNLGRPYALVEMVCGPAPKLGRKCASADKGGLKRSRHLSLTLSRSQCNCYHRYDVSGSIKLNNIDNRSRYPLICLIPKRRLLKKWPLPIPSLEVAGGNRHLRYF